MIKLIMIVVLIIQCNCDTFGLKESCKKIIPDVWNALFEEVASNIQQGLNLNSTKAINLWGAAFQSTCVFTGNQTITAITVQERLEMFKLSWPQKPTWNMTCDDNKEISLAQAEFNVLSSFPQGSLKDPLLKAFVKADLTLFSDCERMWSDEFLTNKLYKTEDI